MPKYCCYDCYFGSVKKKYFNTFNQIQNYDCKKYCEFCWLRFKVLVIVEERTKDKEA